MALRSSLENTESWRDFRGCVASLKELARRILRADILLELVRRILASPPEFSLNDWEAGRPRVFWISGSAAKKELLRRGVELSKNELFLRASSVELSLCTDELETCRTRTLWISGSKKELLRWELFRNELFLRAGWAAAGEGAVGGRSLRSSAIVSAVVDSRLLGAVGLEGVVVVGFMPKSHRRALETVEERVLEEV
jgi:hypothetical protein